MAKRTLTSALHERLLDQLAGWSADSSTPGAERRTVVTADDLEVELTMTVRRRVLPEKAAVYRSAAAAQLADKPFLARHCGCYVNAKSSWGGRRERDCKGRVVAAAVYQSSRRPGGDLGFLFVCGRHREGHRIEPDRLLGLVELPAAMLEDAIRRADELQARSAAEDHVEQEKLDREREARRAAAAAAAAPPPGRRVRHLISVADKPTSADPTKKER